MSDDYIEEDIEIIEQEINDLFDEAENNDDLVEKIKIYEQIILKGEESDVDDRFIITAYNELFSIYSQKEEFSKQIEILDELIDIDELNKDVYLKRKVKIYKDIKDYELAIRYQLEVLDFQYKPTELIVLADLYNDKGDDKKRDEYLNLTIKLYEELISESKDNQSKITSYRIVIIGFLFRLNDLERIEKQYLKIIEEDVSNKIKNKIKLSEFYEKYKKEYKKAIDLYQELISLNSKEKITYKEKIASLYKYIPNFEESIKQYEELIKIDAQNEEKYLNKIIDIYINNLTNYTKALEKYRILESKTKKILYTEKIANFHLDYTKDYYQAIDLFKDLVSSNYSEKIKYLEKIASIYEDNIHEYDEAIIIYEQLTEQNPQNKLIYQKSIMRLYWNSKKNISKTIEIIEDFFGENPSDLEIKSIYDKAKNIITSKELDDKGRIGDQFESTEKEFKKTLVIYMLLILNVVFLILIFNKDIFFEKKIDRDNRIEKEEKELEQLKKAKEKRDEELIKKAKEKFKSRDKKTEDTKKVVIEKKKESTTKIVNDKNCCVVINNITKVKND